ncbi:hypothetical protein XFF4834R_chr18080 [Xanthomonas citri pv. fuscans]|nr:hypothetical protein XFF4834R_chr18080 [Xanthomonas citri pv. fuscans]
MAAGGAKRVPRGRRLGWRQGKPRGARAVPPTANPPGTPCGAPRPRCAPCLHAPQDASHHLNVHNTLWDASCATQVSGAGPETALKAARQALTRALGTTHISSTQAASRDRWPRPTAARIGRHPSGSGVFVLLFEVAGMLQMAASAGCDACGNVLESSGASREQPPL